MASIRDLEVNGMTMDIVLDPDGRVAAVSVGPAPPPTLAAELGAALRRRRYARYDRKRRALSRSKSVATAMRVEFFRRIEEYASMMHPDNRVELRKAVILLAECSPSDCPAKMARSALEGGLRYAVRLALEKPVENSARY
jgi:hypothetical protein